jgi:hypothetical protein
LAEKLTIKSNALKVKSGISSAGNKQGLEELQKAEIMAISGILRLSCCVV